MYFNCNFLVYLHFMQFSVRTFHHVRYAHMFFFTFKIFFFLTKYISLISLPVYSSSFMLYLICCGIYLMNYFQCFWFASKISIWFIFMDSNSLVHSPSSYLFFKYSSHNYFKISIQLSPILCLFAMWLFLLSVFLF